MCRADLLRSVGFWCLVVWFQVHLFQSTVVIINDGCSSGALVLWGLGTTTSCLSITTSSTTTSFASGDGGARTEVRLRLALVFVVVARWSSDLFVIFITFGTLCIVVDDY
jgi:hypothetical protein